MVYTKKCAILMMSYFQVVLRDSVKQTLNGYFSDDKDSNQECYSELEGDFELLSLSCCRKILSTHLPVGSITGRVFDCQVYT